METVKLCPGVGQKGEAVLLNVTEKATLQYARIIRNFLYLTSCKFLYKTGMIQNWQDIIFE